MRKTSCIALLILAGITFGCGKVPIPKPRGYFRIDLPEKKYVPSEEQKILGNDIPFTFEYPVYGKLSFDRDYPGEEGWFNIEFPSYKAKIYLTYKKINSDFENLMEQNYRLNITNHISKADAINEQLIIDEEDRVFGILYDLKGNTASAVQFYVTDSSRHFLRGSLYFSAEPDADSLLPVIEFFRDDIIHMIETLKWNK